jgi:flagellar motility protein MotE (MotC chaperone)
MVIKKRNYRLYPVKINERILMKNKFLVITAALVGMVVLDVHISYADAAFWKEKDREEAATQEKLHEQKLEIMDAKADAKLRQQEEKTEQERLRLHREEVRLQEKELQRERLRPQNTYIIVEP